MPLHVHQTLCELRTGKETGEQVDAQKQIRKQEWILTFFAMVRSFCIRPLNLYRVIQGSKVSHANAGDHQAFVAVNAIADVAAGVPWHAGPLATGFEL